MGRIPTGIVVWNLKRYTRNSNLWDRACSGCKQITPTFEHEYRDEQGRPAFGYLCEQCAQQKLFLWLQPAESSSDQEHPDNHTDFDSATVFYEQKNDGETLVLTRWSSEQRRRRLQGTEADV